MLGDLDRIEDRQVTARDHDVGIYAVAEYVQFAF
jgi:hypothetical protein